MGERKTIIFCPIEIPQQQQKKKKKFLNPNDEPAHHQNVLDCFLGHFPPLWKI